MKRVKADAAAIRIKNRISQKMVEVDEHGAQHYQISIPPVFFPEQPGKNQWQQNMAGIMDYMSENTNVPFHAICESCLLMNVKRTEWPPLIAGFDDGEQRFATVVAIDGLEGQADAV